MNFPSNNGNHRGIDARAVSPVIGTVLLVALTVLLAVTISATALGLGVAAEPVPTARFSFAYEAGTGLVVTHEGGRTIPAAELRIVGEDPEGTAAFGPWARSGDVGAGDTTVLTGVDGNEVVRVVWTGESRSGVLASVSLDFKPPFVYELSDGAVRIEAEAWTGTTPGTGTAADRIWFQNLTTTPETAGASGDSYLTAIIDPDAAAPDRSDVNTDRNGDGVLDAQGPRADYRIAFDAPGTYHVHVRMAGDSNQDDSVHVGIDGTLVSDASHATSKNYGMTAGTNGSWQWTDEAATRVVSFDVTDPGVHTLNIEMREDGTRVDVLVVTDDPTYRL
jgi:flagellin-like protein